MRHGILAASLLFSAGIAVAGKATPRTLSFEDRVRAQEAIERVYWSHRIWPKENPTPKPPLSAVMPEATIRAKVEEYLTKTAALESLWKRPITEEQLQAELDRMSRNTMDAETLQELYRALGNDAAVIAQTLARQTLVERLIHDWYVNDVRFHGELKAKAEAALATCGGVDCLKSLSGEYREITWRRGLDDDQQPSETNPSSSLAADEWMERLDRLAKSLASSPNAIPTRRLSDLEETPEAFVVTAVLSQRECELTLATVTWPKRSFDSWWAAERDAIAPWVEPRSGVFALSAVTLTPCVNDTWVPTRFEVPDPRFNQTAVWTGTEMIVWGGNAGGNGGAIYLNSGGRYNPATDTWTVTSTGANVPTGRELHTAVWSGSEMIVWGGWNGSVDLNTGGRYNPTTDTWFATSTGSSVPSVRRDHTAVWSGTRMIVWGGQDVQPYPTSGGRYDPSTDTWTPTSIGANVPTGRVNHTAIWAGTRMIVWGGNAPDLANTGGIYDPVANAWSATSTGANVPSVRSRHSAVWTGTEMIVWGGTELNTGGRYNPTTNTWTATSTGANIPFSRSKHTAVWTGAEMIIWGGTNFQASTTGGRYDPLADTWKRVSTGANAPSSRTEHTAVWTGTEMIIWGGSRSHSTSDNSNTGGRYDPSSDSWVATSNGQKVTAARQQHTAVWTGAESITWGGFDGSRSINTGGRYNPSTDSSTPTSTGLDVPNERARHTAVWTGTHMIVWGGYEYIGNTYFNNGGRYSPLTDSWSPISTEANVPIGRYGHSMVWTGTEAIVWGGWSGNNYIDSGGRYAPTSDTWTPTSMGTNAPSRRTNHTVVWTGTEMIVWGGFGGGYGASGSRYNPLSDTWTFTSTLENLPVGRSGHTAVWTGTEMIVWGGFSGAGYPNTGGRYNPSSDTWLQTSTGANVPAGRNYPTSVWTGKEMIIWGGVNCSLCYLNTGARYDPSTNAWTATATGAVAPSGRYLHTATWTGTEMVVWGGVPTTSTGGRYCACPGGRIYFRDADGDGYGDTGVGIPSCDGTVPAGYIGVGFDCDDSNPSVHPGATETCNGIDEDCNELVDESAVAEDSDGDAVHELCDNCTLTWNATQTDTDHDGEGDACDLNDGLIYVYSIEKNSRNWQAETGYASWNSYRSSLAGLRATGQYTQAPGSNPLAAHDCGLSDPYVLDPLIPDPDDVAFHLVTGVSGGIESSLGTNSASVPRANANPCP